jgi:peroxiredoxin
MSSTLKTQVIGCTVDDFSRPNIRGGEQSLTGALDGKKGAVVLFWSGICSHCTRYDSYLNGFEERHPELALFGIASRSGETAEQLLKVCTDRGLMFPILHDAGSALAREWFTQQTPRAFLVDSERKLLYRGAIDNFKYPGDPRIVDYLEPAIAEFLSGQPVGRSETASFGCAIQSVYYLLPKSL